MKNRSHKESVFFYTRYEVVFGISGQEFARNFDFSIEQNQRLSNAKELSKNKSPNYFDCWGGEFL